MKTLLLTLVVSGFAAAPSRAQTAQTPTTAVPAGPGYTVVERDASRRVWQRIDWETGPAAQRIPHTHRFTELGSGMHFMRDGQWQETSVQIRPLPGGLGAAATNGPHQIFFPADIYDGAIRTVTPDGKTLTSRPAVLSYLDGTNNVAISYLAHSVAQILPSGDRVIYTNCFPGLADLVGTYRKDGFECDLVFRHPPATPGSLGLSPAHSRLQLWTEWFNTPEPQTVAAAPDPTDGLADSPTLEFGAFKIVRGKAFSVSLPSTAPSQPAHANKPLHIYKSWQKWQNRSFLVEEVPFRRIAGQLSELSNAERPSGTKLLARRLSTPKAYDKMPPAQERGRAVPGPACPPIPAHRPPEPGAKQVLLARSDLAARPGVVWDWTGLSGSTPAYTCTGDMTYYISDDFWCDALVIEGGAVLKFPSTQYSTVIGAGQITCQTGPFHEGILTSADDDSVGETLRGISTGSPQTGTGSSWLITSCDSDLHYLRFNFAGGAIDNECPNLTISHCQFVQCGTVVATHGEGGSIAFRNVLAGQCASLADLSGNDCKLDAQHLTFAGPGNMIPIIVGCPNTVNPDLSGASFLNCIFSDVEGGLSDNVFPVVGSNNGFYNGGQFGDNPVPLDDYPFQTGGAGNYYLAGSSPCHGAGITPADSTQIDPSLLASLQHKTTYPPVVLSDTVIGSDQTLPPQAPRETTPPDLGFGYDAIDYFFNGVTCDANLSFAPGTACAWSVASGYGYSLQITDGHNVSFNGTATDPCYWVRCTTVQEGAGAEPWAPGSITASTWPNFSQTPVVSPHFTRFSIPGGDMTHMRDNYGYLVVHARDCEFWGGSLGGYCSQLNYTNCLFDRVTLWTAWYGTPFPTTDCSLILQNCLMRGGYFGPSRSGPDENSQFPFWSIHDTAFDRTTLSFDDAASGNPDYTSFDYNAFLTGADRTSPIGPNDVLVPGTFNWQTNRFGNFYLPSDSHLKDSGSTTADQVGLYHYTSQAAQPQPKEANSQRVTIGYHYVALDGGGNPYDSDGDTLPDYLEDSNGSGAYEPDADMSDWQNPFTDGTGMDDGWEFKYFGQINLDPYADPDGDGYGNLEEYENGTNPLAFNSPSKSVTSIQVLRDPLNPNNVVVSWQPASPSTTSYTIARTVNGTTTSYTFPAGTTSWTDTSLPAGSSATYTVTPNYPGGSAAPSPSGDPDYNALLAVDPEIVRGPTLADPSLSPLQIVLGGQMPASVVKIRVYRQIVPMQYRAYLGYDQNGFNYWAWKFYTPSGWTVNWPGNIDAGSFDVPINQFVNGVYHIPWSASPGAAGVSPWFGYQFQMAPIGADNRPGVKTDPVFARSIPFVDGSAAAKKNLTFVLRAARGGTPSATTLRFGATSSYAQASPFVMRQSLALPAVDELSAFYENWFLRNWAYSGSDFYWDSDQNNTYAQFWLGNQLYPNGVNFGLNQYHDDPETVYYNFDGASYVAGYNSQGTSSQLSDADYIYLQQTELHYSPNDLTDAGITWNDSTLSETLALGFNNQFGLTYQSVRAVQNRYPHGTPLGSLNVRDFAAGGSSPNPDPGYYSEYFQNVAAPTLTTAGYYFVPDAKSSSVLSAYPMPGDPNFSPVLTTPLIITAVGQELGIYGWAMQSIGSSGKYAYLGQYFDKAYKTDAIGNRTSMQTGILSEYGEFFATEPGKTILMTKPDPDQGGQQGQCMVYAISLNVDANHDSAMDLTYGGSDTTSPVTPYVFWVNNNYDRLAPDADDAVSYEDDTSGYIPGTLQHDTPDCNYTSGGLRTIPSIRDLEDFARLWISGITPELRAALPAGATISLSWGGTITADPNNPTIDLFSAADPDGGMGYLTDPSLSASQSQSSGSLYLGRLGPGRSVRLSTTAWPGNHFIWCGVNAGSGALTLTIADGSGATLAQTKVFVEVRDIKDMYERWSIGDWNTTTRAPYSTPVQLGIRQYPVSQSSSTPYILLVHGWNNPVWAKDRFAESAFKRLYWQGYQGRFGSFRWPTDYGFDATSFINAMLHPHNYDDSEINAWRSAPGLMSLLTTLNAQYPGSVYILAHSMGNVVAGEALRLAANQGLGQIVNTYVASQAAIPAHVYDASVTSPYLINYSYINPKLSALVPGSPKTPNIYGNRLAANTAAVGRRVSLYNPNDYALSPDAWCTDQELKPDTFLGGYYHYAGSVNDPAPWNNFEFFPRGESPLTLDIVGSLQDRYDALAYAADPYSRALGSTPGVGGFTQNIDLRTIWPPDPVHPAHPFDEHFYHSAQFRGEYWQQQGYWSELLSSDGFNLK